MGRPQFELTRDVLATAICYLVDGWRKARSGGVIDLTTNEVDIAGHLVSAIYTRIAEDPCPPALRFEEEVGTRSLGSSKPDGRIDVKVLYSFNPPQAFLGVEFKRVAGNDAKLCRAYVAEGVIRFVSGKYGPGHDWGALGAFVIDSDAAGATSRIEKELHKNPDSAILGGFELSTEWGFGCEAYSSLHHQEPGHNEIRLLHLLLD